MSAGDIFKIKQYFKLMRRKRQEQGRKESLKWWLKISISRYKPNDQTILNLKQYDLAIDFLKIIYLWIRNIHQEIRQTYQQYHALFR